MSAVPPAGIGQTKRRLQRLGIYVAIALILAVFLIPIYSMLVMSFKTPAHVIDQPLLPFSDMTLDNYATVLFGDPLKGANQATGSGVAFVRALMNSLIVALGSTLIALVAGVPAGYALARSRRGWVVPAAVFILATRFLPPLAIVLPFYAIFNALRLTDTLIALVVVYVAMNISIVIWMVMGFVRDIPRDIEESAMVDGAGPFQTIWHITLPLVAPGLASTAIFVMFLAWNEFLMAVILTNTASITAPVAALTYIRHMYVAWGPLMAAGALVAVPILIFALIIQRRLVRGLTAGAIRG